MPSKSIGRNFKIKDGKLVRVTTYRSKSAQIAARKSKKPRAVSRSAASQMDLMLGRRGK